MKKFISMFLAVCTALTLASCGGGATDNPATPTPATPTPVEATTPTPDPTTPEPVETTPEVAFEGKIGIITQTVSQNEEEYRSAELMQTRYGKDKITHVTWPDQFMQEQEQMVSIVTKLGADPEIKAIVINQAVPGTNAAVDKLRETREDIFVAYVTPQENPEDVVERANIILMPNEPLMGPKMVQQAQKLGAKVFVHYSFPRHMSQPLLSGRRELIKEECAKLGIEFVDLTAPDPQGDLGMTGAQQFVLEDVPKIIDEYGKDTAIFSTNCGLQIPLITALVETGGIYPQPCDPSPFHGFPAALGLEAPDLSKEGAVENIVAQTMAILSEKGLLGRFSTWPVSGPMMATVALTEYSVKVLNGEVSRDAADLAALKQCMEDYAGMPITEFGLYTDEAKDVTYPTFCMFLLDYLTYE